MTTDTSARIVALIRENSQLSPGTLAKMLKIGPSAVHRQLLKLVKEGKIVKIGTSPRVFYSLPKVVKNSPTKIFKTNHETMNKTDKYYLLVNNISGSGSSFNETARKIRETGFDGQIICFAIVGSMNGFDVLREV